MVRPGGRVELELEELVLEGGRPLSVRGRLSWEEAALTGDGPALGALRLNLRTEAPGKIKGVLRDGGGPVRVDGILELSGEGNYRLTGTLVAGPKASPEITQALQFIGRPTGDGKRAISFSGRMPPLLR